MSLIQNKQGKKYIMYFTASHEWLQVTHRELADLGITDKISGYSYRDKTYAYLEGDCDAVKFVEKKKAVEPGFTITDNLTEREVDEQSPIFGESYK